MRAKGVYKMTLKPIDEKTTSERPLWPQNGSLKKRKWVNLSH